MAAARHGAGVTRSTGNRWKNGNNLYRRDQLVGFRVGVDPVERPSRSGSLSAEERVEIADRLRAGESIRPMPCEVPE
jgi:hypothetical protein